MYHFFLCQRIIIDREYLLIILSGSPQNNNVLWGEHKVAGPNPATSSKKVIYLACITFFMPTNSY